MLDVLPVARHMWRGQMRFQTIKRVPGFYDDNRIRTGWSLGFDSAFCVHRRCIAAATGFPQDVGDICLESFKEVGACAGFQVDCCDHMNHNASCCRFCKKRNHTKTRRHHQVGIPALESKGHKALDFIDEILSPEDREPAVLALRRALEGKPAKALPMTVKARSGPDVPVIPGATFVHGSDGRPTVVVVTLRDINELRAAHATLAVSERKYRELFCQVSNRRDQIRPPIPTNTKTRAGNSMIIHIRESPKRSMERPIPFMTKKHDNPLITPETAIAAPNGRLSLRNNAPTIAGYSQDQHKAPRRSPPAANI